MSNVSSWSTTAASNNAAPPNGFPEGQSPSSLNDCARENMASVSKWYKDTQGTLATTGSSNAYVLTTNSAHATLGAQSIFVFRANHSNTGAATLNVDELGAKSIYFNGAALPTGTIVANTTYMVAYNSTNDVYDLVSSATIDLSSVGTPVRDYQAFTSSGTWTKPADITFVMVEAWGGGAGGCNNTASSANACGGGGGEYVCAIFQAADLASTETVTIGAGGAGGTNGVNESAGAAGGTTSFGAWLEAVGGNGGLGTAPARVTKLPGTPSPTASAAFSGSVFETAIFPQAGPGYTGNGLKTIMGGAGGGGSAGTTGGTSEYGGNGGAGNNTAATAGTAGTAPGGGGGGSGSDGGGGAGARGEMRITSW